MFQLRPPTGRRIMGQQLLYRAASRAIPDLHPVTGDGTQRRHRATLSWLPYVGTRPFKATAVTRNAGLAPSCRIQRTPASSVALGEGGGLFLDTSPAKLDSFASSFVVQDL